MFLPTSLDAATTSVAARIKGDPDLARQTLREHLARVDPNMGQIVTMRTVARLETLFPQIAFWVSVILGGLALLLTVSGRFGVLSCLDSRDPSGAGGSNEDAAAGVTKSLGFWRE